MIKLQSSSANKLLDRLDNVRKTGEGKWLARCPAHSDKSPSLAIKEADDRVLLYCFAGCDTATVLGSIGLTFDDLFPSRHGRDHDASQPRQNAPRFRASELLPLVVTEAYILALARRQVIDGIPLSDDDLIRAQQAEEAVSRAWVEVCG